MSIFSNNTNRYLMTIGRILTKSISDDAIYEVFKYYRTEMIIHMKADDTVEKAYNDLKESDYMRDILVIFALLGETELADIMLNEFTDEQWAFTVAMIIKPMLEERKAEINKILNEYCFE